jgi:hypothetical protein
MLQGMKGDIALMEVFANKNFTEKEMNEINRCRMYLQAFYLSDIADIAGQHIDTRAIKRNVMERCAVSGNGQYNSNPPPRDGRHGTR